MFEFITVILIFIFLAGLNSKLNEEKKDIKTRKGNQEFPHLNELGYRVLLACSEMYNNYLNNHKPELCRFCALPGHRCVACPWKTIEYSSCAKWLNERSFRTLSFSELADYSDKQLAKIDFFKARLPMIARWISVIQNPNECPPIYLKRNFK